MWECAGGCHDNEDFTVVREEERTATYKTIYRRDDKYLADGHTAIVQGTEEEELHAPYCSVCGALVKRTDTQVEKGKHAYEVSWRSKNQENLRLFPVAVNMQVESGNTMELHQVLVEFAVANHNEEDVVIQNIRRL